MKVAFIMPSIYFEQNKQMYKEVNAAIERTGHELWARGDEILVTESIGDKNALDAEDWEVLCNRELAIARECDAAIVDVTNKSTFGVGYFAATALQAGKPTLFLMHKNSLQGSVISGLRHKKLSRAVYDESNIEDVIQTFLQGISQ